MSAVTSLDLRRTASLITWSLRCMHDDVWHTPPCLICSMGLHNDRRCQQCIGMAGVTEAHLSDSRVDQDAPEAEAGKVIAQQGALLQG
jgi:hypothetical protein